MTDQEEHGYHSAGSHSVDFSDGQDTGSNSASQTIVLQQLPAGRNRAAVPVDHTVTMADVQEESDSDYFSDGTVQHVSNSGSDAEEMQLLPPARYNEAYTSTTGYVIDNRQWDISVGRTLQNKPIKEIRLLLEEWSKLTMRKLNPTPSMKLAYKRLREGHRWLELPPIPPCILLPYKLEGVKQMAIPEWEYKRLGVGPLVHGFIECYNVYSLSCDDDFRPAGPTTFLFFRHAPETTRNNRLFMILALHLNPKCLRYAGDNVLCCLPMLTYAIRKDPFCLEYVPDELKRNLDFVKLACSIDPGAIVFAHISIRRNRDFVRPILQKEGHLLQVMPPSIKDDAELVSVAMEENAYTIRYASKRLRDDRSFVMSEVKKDWNALSKASNRLKNDKEIALIAVRQSDDAISSIGDKVLRKCPEIMNIAIVSSGGECAFKSNNFEHLSKVQIIDALTLSPSSYHKLPDQLKKDRDIVSTVLRQDWTLMRMMLGKVILSLSDMYTIIRHDGWYYIPEKIGDAKLITLGLPWTTHQHNLSLFIEGIKKDRRIIRHASRMHKGHPRIVFEAMKCYEDIGKGTIDPLKTAPYRWCNMNVLAKSLAIMNDDSTKHKLRKQLLSHFICRFSRVHTSESVGISRVYRILKKNVDLFYNAV